MPALTARLALVAATVLPAVCAATTLDLAGLARDVSPCDDFYAWANDHWLQATAIPDDKPRWGTFDEIAKRNKERLQGLLAAAAAANPFPPGSNRHKVVAYYASGMDEAAIERAGLRPLEPLLAAADAVKTPADLPPALATLHRAGVPAAFSLAVRQDAKDSRRYLAQFLPGGLGLPDRDYYFRDDERSKAQREAYRAHVARILRLAGEDEAGAASVADGVLAFETELARAQMTLVERRDPDRTYNLRRTEALAHEAPGFGWKVYFRAMGVADLGEINVTQPAAASALAAMAASRPAADWRAYLRWQVLRAAAPRLPKAFEEAHFDFHQRTLAGVQRMPPRNERVIDAIAGPYGGEPLAHALGELFVGEAFPAEAKRRALDLVGHVRAALRERLEKLDWMEPATRRAALDKLDRMAVKIGYPDRWRDFSAAAVGDKPYVANWIAASEFETRRSLARLGRPVDRGEWWMSPHIVNAYYGATLNEIVFPAGILQPPYFDPKADDAVNFGGIGMIIGHEIMHGFDDRGRRYDADGNLRDWWTEADRKRYQERAQAIVAQYDAYSGIDGLRVNGKLTLGENIADLGGIQIAYLGLQRALAGTPRARVDGFTPEQRFFLSFAQSWRSRYRPEMERLRLLTDSHSPPRYRVQGPLANLPEFAAAFSCPANARALRAEGERVDLW